MGGPVPNISMQYHLPPQQPQQQPQPYSGQRGPAPSGGQVMTPGAPSFNPGGPYGGSGMPVQCPPHSHPGQMGSAGQPNQPANIIYSGGPPSLNMNMQQHPGMVGLYGGHRFQIPPHMMNQHMQQQQQQPQHMQQQLPGPPQGQMAPPGVSQQGGPPGQHPQGGPPGQHPNLPQQQHIYQPPSHQPPRPQVSSMNTSMNSSMNSLPTGAPPPAATTPPTLSSGPPSLPPQNIPSQPPSAQNTLNRTRKRIAIIDPTTKQEVSVDGTSKSPQQPPPASTPEQSSTSSTPAPEPEKPARSASGVAAEFAAKVAAVAEGSVKKEDSPAPKKEASPVEEETQEPVKEATPEAVEVVAPEPTIEPETPTPGTPPHVSSDPSSTLSVTTDLKGDEPLYEPVSPTPLPDSPMDENKVTEVTKPSPFEEVINKKVGVTGIKEREESADEAVGEAKRGKKKQSAASRRAALNSKGEKKGDLLDVFTTPPEEKTAEAIPTVTKKSPTPEPSASVPKEELKVEATPPVVDEVSQVVEEVEKMEIVDIPTEETTKSVDPLVEESANHVEETSSVVDAPVAAAKPIAETAAPQVNGILDSIPMELRRSESTKSEKEDTAELEEGEIGDDDEEENVNPDDPKSLKLKYTYQEDQWSPLNPEGKKQYDREFLICLQRDPLSLQKPCNLPNMEIVKDKPNLAKSGGGGVAPSRFDFTPGFVIKTNSRQGVNKRGSQGGDKSGRGRDSRDGRDNR